MKTIFVTGGAGFIASHVVIHLVKTYPECRIINVDKLDYCSSLKNLTEIENYPNYKFYIANIIDAHTIRRIFEIEKVDTVMHFAAQTHVDNSFGNSFQFTENNVMGTHVLLEVSKNAKVKRFIHVSTDEVYGETLENDATEKALLNPTNPYSASKAAAEMMVKSFYLSFGLPIIITRGNNVFGPHQFPEKLIPKFTTLLDRNQKCPIHGEGKEKRSYIYVSDVVRAFDIILRKGTIGEVYNIGTTREISNAEVTKKLTELFKNMRFTFLIAFLILISLVHSEKKKIIYLVRHGETNFNTDPVPRVRGRINVPLNDVGIAHCKAAGDFLANENIGKIYYSAIPRAKQSADCIVEKHSTPVEMIEDPLVIDISWGVYEGKTYLEAFGDEKGGDLMFHPEKLVVPEGETFYAVMDRLRLFFVKFWNSDEEVCTIVSHGAITNVLSLMFLQAPLEKFWSMYMSACGVSKVQMKSIYSFTIEYWNANHFLKEGEKKYLKK